MKLYIEYAEGKDYFIISIVKLFTMHLYNDIISNEFCNKIISKVNIFYTYKNLLLVMLILIHAHDKLFNPDYQ